MRDLPLPPIKVRFGFSISEYIAGLLSGVFRQAQACLNDRHSNPPVKRGGMKAGNGYPCLAMFYWSCKGFLFGGIEDFRLINSRGLADRKVCLGAGFRERVRCLDKLKGRLHDCGSAEKSFISSAPRPARILRVNLFLAGAGNVVG
jgi:hypothetical protein